MTVQTRGFLAVIGAGVLWGATYPIVKLVLQEVTAIEIAFYRAVYSSILLALYLLPTLRAIRPTRREYAQLLALSVLGVSAFWILMNFAIEFSTATQAALLVALYPLLLALLASPLLGERLQRRVLGAVLLGLFGAYLTITDGRLAAPVSLATLAGDLIALVAALAYALYLVFTRRFYATSRLSPAYVTAQLFFLAVPPLLLALLVTGTTFVPWAATPTTAISMVWLGTVPSALGFLLINRGLRAVSAPQAAVALLVFPPVAAITAYVLLGETLTFVRALGGVCILAGIAVAHVRAPAKHYN
jgi:drug/metabolite transporter (DMT)-like permease